MPGETPIILPVSDRCCSAQLDIADLEARQRRVLVSVFVINVVTFLMMVIGSLASGSSSLLSGTLDNLGDALTYAASLAVVSASSRIKARVAFLKGLLILIAAFAVAGHIGWRVTHFEAPVVTTMGTVAVLNLAANAFCLLLLSPYRYGDVNMSSVWECSRNDVIEGFAVIATTIAVWLFNSGWPDVLVAVALLILFLRSAFRVLSSAWRELRPGLSET
jgi:Co/Zn/Cd efflux system component